jgi:hypothetical protein
MYQNTQENFDILDNYIKTHTESDDIFCRISSKHLDKGKKIYHEMQKSLNVRFEIFGYNGQGLTSFGLYKSKEQKIYLIYAQEQPVVGYTIITPENDRYLL